MTGPESLDVMLRRGADEFDARRYFDAHETWEEIWHHLEGEDRLFIQALIQASVALHHFHGSNQAGASQLARATLAKLAVLPATYRGVNCEAFADAFADYFDELLRARTREARDAVRPPLLAPPRLGPFLGPRVD